MSNKILIFEFQIFMNMRLILEVAMSHSKPQLTCFKITGVLLELNIDDLTQF